MLMRVGWLSFKSAHVTIFNKALYLFHVKPIFLQPKVIYYVFLVFTLKSSEYILCTCIPHLVQANNNKPVWYTMYILTSLDSPWDKQGLLIAALHNPCKPFLLHDIFAIHRFLMTSYYFLDMYVNKINVLNIHAYLPSLVLQSNEN